MLGSSSRKPARSQKMARDGPSRPRFSRSAALRSPKAKIGSFWRLFNRVMPKWLAKRSWWEIIKEIATINVSNLWWTDFYKMRNSPRGSPSIKNLHKYRSPCINSSLIAVLLMNRVFSSWWKGHLEINSAWLIPDLPSRWLDIYVVNCSREINDSESPVAAHPHPRGDFN